MTIGGSGHRSHENIIWIFIFGLSGWQLTSLVPLVARIEQKWLLTSNDKGTSSQQTITGKRENKTIKDECITIIKRIILNQ